MLTLKMMTIPSLKKKLQLATMADFLFVFLLIVMTSSSIVSAKDSTPYIVFLKKGTVLKRLKDNTTFILPKGIYAKALEFNPKERDQFYIYDKNGVASYLTSFHGVVEIANDIQLLPEMHADIIYPPKDVFKTSNSTAVLNSVLNLHFDHFDMTPFNEIYNGQASNVISTRYEMRTLYVSDMFFKFGFAINYASADWESNLEKVQLSILSIGPHFQYNFYQTKNFNIYGLLGAELAPIYQGTSANYKEKYSAQLYDLGIESEWPNALGVFTFGSHFRHHALALQESNRDNINLRPKEFTLNTLGIMLGYKIEWQL